MPRIAKQRLLSLQKSLKLDAAIGKKLGISRPTVIMLREKYGIPSLYTFTQVPKISKKNFVRLRKELVTGAAIARKLGVSPQVVDKMRKKLGVESRYAGYPARDAAIKAAYKNGAKVINIAKKYGISTINVYRIINAL